MCLHFSSLILLLYLKWYFGSIKNPVVSSSSYHSRSASLSLAENHEQQENWAEQMKRMGGWSQFVLLRCGTFGITPDMKNLTFSSESVLLCGQSALLQGTGLLKKTWSVSSPKMLCVQALTYHNFIISALSVFQVAFRLLLWRLKLPKGTGHHQ